MQAGRVEAGQMFKRGGRGRTSLYIGGVVQGDLEAGRRTARRGPAGRSGARRRGMARRSAARRAAGGQVLKARGILSI